MKSKPVEVDKNDLMITEAKNVLLDFFSRMKEWEEEYAKLEQLREKVPQPAKQERMRIKIDAERQASCQQIFQTYCTKKERLGGKPSVMSYRVPSGYKIKSKDISEIKVLSPSKITFTVDTYYGKYCFFVFRKFGQWLIDHRMMWSGGKWVRSYL